METLDTKIQQNSANKYYCIFCDYGTSRKCNYDTHINSSRHYKNSANSANSVSNYYCINCHYVTSRKCNYDTHIISSKHLKNSAKSATTNSANSANSAILIKVHEKPENSKFLCEFCEKEYSNRCSLSKHKKKCKYNEATDKELIMMLIKENSELKNMMIKVLENGTNNYNNTNTTTNSHNKTFNLQVFLNETCKDAMNISEFIENISLQLSDLENMGKLGYVDGVSNIIIKNLNALDVTQRPLHCTDKKREIVYVKEDDEWQKEQEDKKRIKSVISSVVSKNLKLLPEYEDKYPECMNPESKKSDEYNKIIMETIGGCKDVIERNKEKVIRKIAKSVTIDKID